MRSGHLTRLLKEVRACTVCQDHLPLEPRPVLQAHEDSQLLIVGQAPGLKVHKSGIPWNDASGDRLRDWLGLSRDIFYNEKRVAILPIGFCYPGTGEHGDLPPRKECFPLWHPRLLAEMTKIRVTLLVGSYAQATYLGRKRKKSLTETVRSWEEYLPDYIPLPHPSPLNNIWLHKNPWFQETALPKIKKIVQKRLRS